MSNSSSSLSLAPRRNQKQKQKQRQANNGKSLLKLSGRIASVSGNVQAMIRTFEQSFVMNKANINISTGATTYNNPTSSACYYGSGATNVTNDPMAASFFTLADMPQSSTFTALFDQYRIDNIAVTFTPTLTGNTNLESASNQLVLPDYSFWYTVDLDDASVVSPLTALMEYEGAQRVVFTGKPFTVEWVPHAALAAYSGAFTSYSNVKSPWIDCASASVQHYGLKWGCPCPISIVASIPSYSITVAFRVSFRGVR
jgi:hypothetical protein